MHFELQNVTLSYGDRCILNHIDFLIKGREKLALVGPNGAGKTSLLRLIAGELLPDADDKRHSPGIITSGSLRIGFYRQQLFSDPEEKVRDLLTGAPDDSIPEYEYDRILTGLGFQKSDKFRSVGSFSGGEQAKIALIRVLLQKPDLLLLDEPTNHLDIKALTWLEDYLKNYEGGILAVSHDRFFLNKIADGVWELREGRLTKYPGNYSDYRREKQKRLARQKKEYEAQQQEIRRLNELIEKFKHKPNKAAFARSRKKILERMPLIPEPEKDDVEIFTGDLIPKVPMNKWMLDADKLTVGYDAPLLTLSLRIKKGQKIAVIGDNGAGKTAFLKTCAGLIPPFEGKCTLGSRADIGYFDQHTGELSSEESVFDYFTRRFPDLDKKTARSRLAQFLFYGKDLGKRVTDLSGGERARLRLLELLACRPNFLMLDEPTNHLDINARETLETALKNYGGTLLFISHDRYFTEQVADAILVFEGDRALYYPFGYEHYLKKQSQLESYGTESMTAMVNAENEALLQGLKLIPKASRIQSRELSEEEAFVDWQISLTMPDYEEAAQKLSLLQEEIVFLKDEVQEIAHGICWDPENYSTELLESKKEKLGLLISQAEEAEETLTELCLTLDELTIS